MKGHIFFKSIVALLFFALAMPSITFADLGNPPPKGWDDNRGEWQFLGRKTVNHRMDRDVIHLHQRRWEKLQALEFRTSNRYVDLKKAAIVFRDGHVQEIKFRKNRRNGNAIIVELPRHASRIDEIVLWSKAKRGHGRFQHRHARPEIEVWGLKAHHSRRHGYYGGQQGQCNNDWDGNRRRDKRDRRDRRP